MKLAVHQDAHIFQELESEWNALLHRSITDTIFLTVEWQSTWWKTYQAGELWVLTCRDDANRLMGIAPWFIQSKNDERVVRTVGCVDVTDYVDVIVDREHVEPVLSCFSAFLVEERSKYDRINLCNIPESSPTLLQFPTMLKNCGFTVEQVFQEVCPTITLPDSWESYLESLEKKQRHEIRRKLRRAESEAALKYVLIESESEVGAVLDPFLTLMAASQPSKAEFLQDANNRDFFCAVVPLMAARGWLKMSFLHVDGEAVAAYCDFDYNGKILVYNSGLLPERYSNLSTGIVLLAYNIRHAIETGHHIFDFLRGNETYKYRMGAVDTTVYKLMARLAA
ncbi:MAG: GNAT family N-acetyltransferase [Chloroflexota bacterium]|nr:GNAT family N-acetyltransferase [Chloroflexota bacterium]